MQASPKTWAECAQALSPKVKNVVVGFFLAGGIHFAWFLVGIYILIGWLMLVTVSATLWQAIPIHFAMTSSSYVRVKCLPWG